MVHQIHKLFEQLKLIPGQKMEVQKLLFSFIGRNSMHLVWFPCISCMEFRPPWSDFHPLAWKSDSSIPAWCGGVNYCKDISLFLRIGRWTNRKSLTCPTLPFGGNMHSLTKYFHSNRLLHFCVKSPWTPTRVIVLIQSSSGVSKAQIPSSRNFYLADASRLSDH